MAALLCGHRSLPTCSSAPCNPYLPCSQDAVVVAALLCVAAARSAFGSTVQRLMERWQEGGDGGEDFQFSLPLDPLGAHCRTCCIA